MIQLMGFERNRFGMEMAQRDEKQAEAGGDFIHDWWRATQPDIARAEWKTLGQTLFASAGVGFLFAGAPTAAIVCEVIGGIPTVIDHGPRLIKQGQVVFRNLLHRE